MQEEGTADDFDAVLHVARISAVFVRRMCLPAWVMRQRRNDLDGVALSREVSGQLATVASDANRLGTKIQAVNEDPSRARLVSSG